MFFSSEDDEPVLTLISFLVKLPMKELYFKDEMNDAKSMEYGFCCFDAILSGRGNGLFLC